MADGAAASHQRRAGVLQADKMTVRPALLSHRQTDTAHQFGVQKPELKAIARVPQLPQPKMSAAAAAARDTTPVTWLGVSVRNIAGEGEMSAFGLPGVTGVLVLEVPADSALAKAGLRKNDVILSVNSGKTADTAALRQQTQSLPAGSSVKLGLSRDQKESVIEIVP